MKHEKKFESNAQNFEDILLWRCLKNIERGKYIDVGAQDPDSDSVTKIFYDAGWSGINIEPSNQYYGRLLAKRNRDINLNIGVSNVRENLEFYQIEDSGLSTFVKKYADGYEKNGTKGEWRKVEVITLNEVIETYFTSNNIHFLKIDAEGFEIEIIQGLDLKKFRPWIILIEGVEPNTQQSNAYMWQDLLLKENYSNEYFDGLNYFYVSKEHEELAQHFTYPVGIFDNFYLKTSDIGKKREEEIREIAESLEYTKNLNEAICLELDQTRTSLNEIRNSTIWRFSKPMRDAITFLRRIRIKLGAITQISRILFSGQAVLKRYPKVYELMKNSSFWKSKVGQMLYKYYTQHNVISSFENYWVFGAGKKINIENEISKTKEYLKQMYDRKPTKFYELDTLGDLPKVSVLISLYKSEKYLAHFLENLKNQNGFKYIQPVMISSEPSEYERESLLEFAKQNTNVILEFFPQRIGIYQSWNHAIRISDGEYLTNWNVDDVRRNDSINSQAEYLFKRRWLDVVFQDVYYVFKENLDWKTIETIGIKTNLCNVTLGALLNGACPPHNAPMWRRRIHSDIGFFDEKYKSAGDLDFWIRCVLGGKRLLKDNEAHASYFFNQHGMSTNQNSPAKLEIEEIYKNYLRVKKKMMSDFQREAQFLIDQDSNISHNTKKFLDYITEKK
jgi:FkbM family methyltransferase